MSGPIAKFMDLSPPFVIWARCLFGFITLLVIHFFLTNSRPNLPLRNKGILITGLLMCSHWVLFFYSIQMGTVAVAIVAVFTYPLQSIFLEAMMSKQKIDLSYLVVSLFVVLGVYLLSPDFSLANQQTVGLLFGLLSAFTLALRNIYSRSLMEEFSANTVHVSQVLVSGILLFPFAFSETYENISRNIIPLVSLGIFTTAIGHLLLMKSLQYFTATEVGLLNGSQPVAAIVIAFFLVNEVPSTQVILGASIILASVLYAVFKISRKGSNN
jgi:drug/metabolite transporter (DMT)-like permease